MSERFTAIERRSIWQEVAGQISQMIDTRVFEPGQKLPSEREMCVQFGISRISLREALRALERQGYIEVQAGRGAFVRSQIERSQHVLETWIGMSDDNVARVFELRKLFEPNLAALAARSITNANIARLKAAIQALDEHMEDAVGAIAADADFHRILGESTGNPLIESLVHFVMTATGAERSVTLNSTSGVKQAVLGHQKILDRIIARDEPGALKAMEDHLADAVQFASGKRRD